MAQYRQDANAVPCPSSALCFLVSLPRMACVFCILTFLVAACIVTPCDASAARGVTVTFLPDDSGKMSVEAVSSPAVAEEYRVYIPSFMTFSSLPGSFYGAVWLRIAFTPSFEKPVGAVRVAFGQNLPGITRLYIPRLGEDGKEVFTTMSTDSPNAFFELGDGGVFPDTLYARIDGVPGLWFRPVITQAPAKVPPFPLEFVLPGILAAAVLILLLQFLRKAEEWRIWAALAAGCGIVCTFIPPSPVAGAPLTSMSVAAMAVPGLIVLLLTHMARHIFATPSTMPGHDTFLCFYYLAGIATALIPFAPGYLWTAQYLPFWGFLTVPLIVTAITASSRSLRGAFMFMLAVLLIVLGVALAAWELIQTELPYCGGSGALWGLAFGMVLLALTGPTSRKEKAEQSEDVFDSLDRAALGQKDTPAAPAPLELRPDPAPLYATAAQAEVVTTPADANDMPGEGLPTMPASTVGDAHNTPPAPALVTPPVLGHDGIEAKSNASGSMPELHKETTVAMQIEAATPPAASNDSRPVIYDGAEENRILPGSVVTFTDETVLTEVIPPIPETEARLQAADDPAMWHLKEETYSHTAVFDLSLLIKQVYDAVTPEAEKKNIGLTWFLTPQTGRLFEGEAELLRSALQRLLCDMVRNLTRGSIRLNVRRMPDSNNAGNLVFTLVELNAKRMPGTRDMGGLSEAWVLAEKNGGIFSVEHTPMSGSTIIFSSVFTPVDKSTQVMQSAPPDDKATLEPCDGVSGAPSRQLSDTVCETVTQDAFDKDVQETVPPPAEATYAGGATVTTATASQPAVQVFADYPDIEIPKSYEPEGDSATPAGIDAIDLLNNAGDDRDPLRVITVSTTASLRLAMAEALATSPYSVLESNSPATAVVLYSRHPSNLLIMDAAMPEVDIAEAIREIHTIDATRGFSPALFLTLVDHEGQAKRMKRAGSLRTLVKPISAEILLETVMELVPDSFVAPAPAHARKEPVTSSSEIAPPVTTVLPAPTALVECPDAPVAQEAPTTVKEESHNDPAVIDIPEVHTAMASEEKIQPPISIEAEFPAKPVSPLQPAAPLPEPVATEYAHTAAAPVETEAPLVIGGSLSRLPETMLNEALEDIPSLHAPSETPEATADELPETIPGGLFSSILPDNEPVATVEEAKPKRSASDPTPGLLDMIIINEDEVDDASQKPATTEAQPTPVPPDRKSTRLNSSH